MKTMEYGKDNNMVIMLLHGGGLSWWNYQKVAELMADRFRVVIPILDGHAGSDTPFSTIEDNAGRLIEYIDTAFGGHVLLLGGLSLGGQILIEILSQRADICDYAVIESALVLPMKVTAALVGPAFSLCYPLIRQRWFSWLQFRELRIDPALFEEYFRDTAQIARADMIAFLKANADYRIKETLTQSKAKALVLAGSRESPVMKRSARLIAQRLPGAELDILKGFSHGELSVNNAQMYVQHLLRLIQR